MVEPEAAAEKQPATSASLKNAGAVGVENSSGHLDSGDGSYLKPLDLCDLAFSRPFRVFGQRAPAFLAVALVASGLRALLAFVFDVVNGPNYGADYGHQYSGGVDSYFATFDMGPYAYDDPDFEESYAATFDAATYVMLMANALILFVVACLVDAACVKLVADVYATGRQQQRESPVGSSRRRLSPSAVGETVVVAVGAAAERIAPLVGSCLLVYAAVILIWVVSSMLAIFFLFISGSTQAYLLFLLVAFGAAVYVSFVTYLAYPAIVVENAGVIASIRRSFQLTEGYNIFVVVIACLACGFLKLCLSTLIHAATYFDTQGAIIARGVLFFCLNTFFLAIAAM